MPSPNTFSVLLLTLALSNSGQSSYLFFKFSRSVEKTDQLPQKTHAARLGKKRAQQRHKNTTMRSNRRQEHI
ncbi:hypothetical protein HN51_028125 [Arachis hypogaea]